MGLRQFYHHWSVKCTDAYDFKRIVNVRLTHDVNEFFEVGEINPVAFNVFPEVKRVYPASYLDKEGYMWHLRNRYWFIIASWNSSVGAFSISHSNELYKSVRSSFRYSAYKLLACHSVSWGTGATALWSSW